MSIASITFVLKVHESQYQFIKASSVTSTDTIISETAKAKKRLVDEAILRLAMSTITRIKMKLKKIEMMNMEATYGFPKGSKIGRQLEALLESSPFVLFVPFVPLGKCLNNVDPSSAIEWLIKDCRKRLEKI